MRGLNRSIAALLALLLILCIAVPEMADAAALRQGSSGEQVKTLQSKLKRTLCSSLFFYSGLFHFLLLGSSALRSRKKSRSTWAQGSSSTPAVTAGW